VNYADFPLFFLHAEPLQLQLSPDSPPTKILSLRKAFGGIKPIGGDRRDIYATVDNLSLYRTPKRSTAGAIAEPSSAGRRVPPSRSPFAVHVFAHETRQGKASAVPRSYSTNITSTHVNSILSPEVRVTDTSFSPFLSSMFEAVNASRFPLTLIMAS
jgi:hypothetical protein